MAALCIAFAASLLDKKKWMKFNLLFSDTFFNTTISRSSDTFIFIMLSKPMLQLSSKILSQHKLQNWLNTVALPFIHHSKEELANNSYMYSFISRFLIGLLNSICWMHLKNPRLRGKNYWETIEKQDKPSALDREMLLRGATEHFGNHLIQSIKTLLMINTGSTQWGKRGGPDTCNCRKQFFFISQPKVKFLSASALFMINNNHPPSPPISGTDHLIVAKTYSQSCQ